MWSEGGGGRGRRERLSPGGSFFYCLETFMGVDQRTGVGTNPHIPNVVSKSDGDHGTATTARRTLGLMPAGTICHSNLSLSHYPLLSPGEVS